MPNECRSCLNDMTRLAHRCLRKFAVTLCSSKCLRSNHMPPRRIFVSLAYQRSEFKRAEMLAALAAKKNKSLTWAKGRQRQVFNRATEDSGQDIIASDGREQIAGTELTNTRMRST